MDMLTGAERSERMARIKGRNTTPEITVRRLVRGLGHCYRLHSTKLPGRPDLVFGPRRKVIFVHGCFWHYHGESSCKLAHLPKCRLEFWRLKFEASRERDSRNQELFAPWDGNVLSFGSASLATFRRLSEG